MILNRERGGYYLGQTVRFGGSFQTNGVTNPSVIRDGNSNAIATVVYVSVGLFTVTFEGLWPLPEKLITKNVTIDQAEVPTSVVTVRMVKDSYSPVTRSFQVACIDLEIPSATNPDVGDWINFELVGCLDQSGTD